MAASKLPYEILEIDMGQRGSHSVKLMDGKWVTTTANTPKHEVSASCDKTTRTLGEVTFIAAASTSEEDRKLRRLAKSHARKWAYCDRKRQQGKRDGNTTRPSSREPQPSQLTALQALNRVPQPSAPLTSLRPITVSNSPGYKTLMQLFADISARFDYPCGRALTIPSAIAKQGYSMALFDDTAFLLGCWTAIICLRPRDPENSLKASGLLAEILRRIQSSFEPSLRPTEPIIYNVACLCGIHLLLGDKHSWSIHRQGLWALIAKAGGFDSLGESLKLYIIRIDTNSAMHWSLPVIEPPSRPSTTPILRLLNQPLLVKDQIKFLNLIKTTTINVELRVILVDLWLLNSLVRAAFEDTSGSSIIDAFYFEKETLRLEYELYMLEKATSDPLQCAVQAATHVYIRSLITPVDRPSHIIEELQENLRTLKNTQSTLVMLTELLVWLPAIGALASHDPSMRMWFLQDLALHVRGLDEEQSALHIENALDQILWIPQVHNVRFRKLWAEFGR